MVNAPLVLAVEPVVIGVFIVVAVIALVVVFIIGHVQPIAREYWITEKGASVAAKIFLPLVALLIPDMRAFDLLDDLASGIPLDLFLQTAGLGALYVTIYFLVGYFVFAGKEL